MYGRIKQWLGIGRSRAGALTLLLAATQAQAQTLGDVAEAQRAKVLAEIAAAQVAANPPAPRAETPGPSSSGKKARAVSIVVHSLYGRGSSGWTAELTDGKSLAVAQPGMRFGQYLIARIDAEGLHLRAAAGCKKACVPERVVRVGGRL
jgi:hypothetical protein